MEVKFYIDNEETVEMFLAALKANRRQPHLLLLTVKDAEVLMLPGLDGALYPVLRIDLDDVNA